MQQCLSKCNSLNMFLLFKSIFNIYISGLLSFLHSLSLIQQLHMPANSAKFLGTTHVTGSSVP